MTPRVKSLKDLPSWFKRESYADADRLSRRDWVAQFAVRSELLRMASSKDLAELLKPLRAAPLAWLNEQGPLHMLLLTSGYRDSVVLGPKYSRTRLMTGLDRLVIACQVGTERLGQVERWRKEFHRAPLAPESKLLATAHIRLLADQVAQPPGSCQSASLRSHSGLEPLPKVPPRTEVEAVMEACAPDTDWPMAHALFDPTLPDWLLCEQFKKLVIEARATVSPARADHSASRRPVPYNWIRFSVLPLLDLQLWQSETGGQIPRRVLADAIFEPGEGGEDMLRDSSEPWAHVLTTPSYLDQLANWADLEMWDPKGD